MPLLYHETSLRSRIPSITLPSWWRQNVSKYSSKNNGNSSSNNDAITGSTTRDWRSLSPNNPPLPFVQDNDHNGKNSDIYPHTQASERAPKRLPILKKYRHSSYDDSQLQKLSTIIEESDLLTEISLSPKNSSNRYHHHRQRYQQEQEEEEERECGFVTNTLPLQQQQQQQQQHNHDKNDDITVVPSPELPPNDSPHPSSTGSTSPALPPKDATLPSIITTGSASPANNSSFIESSSLTLPPLSNDSIYRPATTTTTIEMTSSSSTATSDSSSLSSASLSLSSTPPLPVVWPIHSKKPKVNNSIPTINENKAKMEFIKMIQAAYTFRQDNNSNVPSEMEILFDSQDNVHKLHVWIHDKIQSHVFEGDAQCIPPELATCRTYHCDRANVWMLGISLYRMLVGKYPFQANNDRRLFSKMQHADFGLPSHLSTDAKDLLCRMLAPEQSRASLDLVKFHPWLKPYSAAVILSPPYHGTIDSTNKKQSSPPIETSKTMGISSSSSSSPRAIQDLQKLSTHIPANHQPRKRKSIVCKLKKVLTFMVHGPCPPPTHPYRDLSPTKSSF